MEPWFDKSGYLIRKIPADCVSNCSQPGDVTQAVQTWIDDLWFEVPRKLAEDYLQAYSAWENLATDSDADITERVLWLACCDIKEQGEWLGLVH